MSGMRLKRPKQTLWHFPRIKRLEDFFYFVVGKKSRHVTLDKSRVSGASNVIGHLRFKFAFSPEHNE
jgi:hypothetical protein